MRKFLGGFLILSVAICAAMFFVTPQNANGTVFAGARPSTAIEYDIPTLFKFNSNDLCALNPSGMYVVRDTINQTDPKGADACNGFDVIRGYAAPDGSVYTDNFEYSAVKFFNNRWYTRPEYDRMIDNKEVPNAAPWFDIYPEQFTESGSYVPIKGCQWELPARSSAGKYGIRARACAISNDGTETLIPVSTNGDYDYYFAIMYAADLTEIDLLTVDGANIYKTSGGEGFQIKILPNAGAIRMGARDIAVNNDEQLVEYGSIGTLGFDFENLNEVAVSIVFNGAVSYNVGWEITGDTMEIFVPAGIQKGKYSIILEHKYNGVYGVFTVDCDDVAGGLFSRANLGLIGTVSMIAGFVGIILGFTLIYGRKISYAHNKKRYDQIDARIYETDAKSVKKREKAERAAKLAAEKEKKEHPENVQKSTVVGGFMNKLDEQRRLREEAKSQGISVEQLKKLEEQRGEEAELKSHSLSDIRKNLGAAEMTEKAGTENTQTGNVKPTVGGGFLDRIRKVTGEDK
jgi:hypothetical protein